MKKIAIFVILIIAAFAVYGHAQGGKTTAQLRTRLAIAGMGQGGPTIPSYCTVAAQCIELTWNNVGVSATVVTGSDGIETSGPATGAIEMCTVTAAQNCAVTNGVPATPSAWSVAPITNGQSLSETSTTGGPFYVTNIAYGQTYEFSETNTYTGAQGGVASLYAAPFQLAFQSAPAAIPSASTGIAAVPVI